MTEEPQLLQLRFKDDPWKVLVCCVLLNRTSRKQVDPIIDVLFEAYPSPSAMARARVGELRELMRPLGFSFQRAQRLVDLSDEWEALGPDPSYESIGTLSGVGPYARDAYRLFVLNDLTVEPEDKKLRQWVNWARTPKGVPEAQTA
jgi:methyl-CpG-binding domain protein 4